MNRLKFSNYFRRWVIEFKKFLITVKNDKHDRLLDFWFNMIDDEK